MNEWKQPTGDLERLVTGREAAQECGVRPVTIRQWVHRGYLKPLGVAQDQGAPSLFRLTDVAEVNRVRSRGGRRGHAS